MTFAEFLSILMDSPLYFTMTVYDRFVYVNEMWAAYKSKFC